MPDETTVVNINGLERRITSNESISYEELCKLAIQPKEYRPTIIYSLGPHLTRELFPGEHAPVRKNAVYNVWIRRSPPPEG